MANKRNLFVNLAVYFVPPLILLLCNAIFPNWEDSGMVWMGFTTMIFGFFYYLGYEHFWYRPKLAKFFRILGLVLNILLGAFAIMTATEMLGGEMVKGWGLKSFEIALYFMPMLFTFFRRSIYEEAYKRVLTDDMNMILVIAAPVALYIVAVIFSLISPLIMTAVAIVVWYIVSIYRRGYVNKFDFLLINTVLHVGVLIAGIVFAVLKAGPAELLLGAGAMTFACGYLYALGYDICTDSDDYDGVVKIQSDWAYRWIFIGILAVSALGILTTGYALSSSHLEGMQFGLRCGFDKVFLYAFYFAPVFYAFTRYYFYDIAWKRGWGSLMRLTVILAYPVACYILAVIALLIGALWFILALALATLIIVLINRKKYSDDESSIGFDDFIEDKPEEEKEDDHFSGNGFNDYLGVITQYPLSLPFHWEWKDIDASYSGGTVYINGTISYGDTTTNVIKELPNVTVTDSVKPAVSYAMRLYRANYKNTIDGVRISTNVRYVKY